MAADYPRFLIDYYANGENIYQDEHAQCPPTIGHGVELAGKFYRITDVWTVHAKREPVTHGTAVFLEEVDVPSVFHAVGGDYYRS